MDMKEEKITSLRIPCWLYARLERIAAERETNVSSIMRYGLKQYVRQQAA